MALKRTARAALCSAWALLVGGCASAPTAQPRAEDEGDAHELPIPADLREDVRRASAIGRQLYLLDKVAAIGTDVLFEYVKDPGDKNLAGYLPVHQADEDGKPVGSFLVAFFTADSPPKIAYEIKVVPDAKPVFLAFDPPKPSTPSFATLVRARKTAIDAMPATSQPINPVLLPAEATGEHGTLVYLLAGTKQPNVAVFGKHFRALVPDGGASVTYMMPMSNSALEVPTRGPDGQEPEALMVSHVVTDCPLETHVFTSLLVKKPVYVGTRRGIWRVDGDDIALISAERPKGLE